MEDHVEDHVRVKRSRDGITCRREADFYPGSTTRSVSKNVQNFDPEMPDIL